MAEILDRSKKTPSYHCHHCWCVGIFIYITLSGAAKGLDNGFDRQFENVAINSMFLWAQNTSKPAEASNRSKPTTENEDAQYLYNRVPELQYIALKQGAFLEVLLQVTFEKQGDLHSGDYPIFTKIATKLFMTEAALSIKPILIKNVRFV